MPEPRTPTATLAPRYRASAQLQAATGAGRLILGGVPGAGVGAQLSPFFVGPPGPKGDKGPPGADGISEMLWTSTNW